MDSADSQWILPLRTYESVQRVHGSSPSTSRVSVDPVFHSPGIMSEHAPPVARLVGVNVNKVVKARGVCFDCLSLRQCDEWKTHYTNLADRLTLVTSLTHLFDWLGKL